MTDNPYSAGQTDDREPWVWQVFYGWCVLLVWAVIMAILAYRQWERDREDVRYYIEAAKESRERAMWKG